MGGAGRGACAGGGAGRGAARRSCAVLQSPAMEEQRVSAAAGPAVPWARGASAGSGAGGGLGVPGRPVRGGGEAGAGSWGVPGAALRGWDRVVHCRPAGRSHWGAGAMCLARSWVSKYGPVQKVLTQPFGLRAFGLLCFPVPGSCFVSSILCGLRCSWPTSFGLGIFVIFPIFKYFCAGASYSPVLQKVRRELPISASV